MAGENKTLKGAEVGILYMSIGPSVLMDTNKNKAFSLHIFHISRLEVIVE
jgi:hypothetical protein